MTEPKRTATDPATRALRALADLVAEAAAHDPNLRAKLAKSLRAAADALSGDVPAPAPAANRPAALDVVAIARRQGAAGLEAALKPLGVEDLRAIVSEHAIDSGRPSRWRDMDEVRRRIAAIAMARAEKGNAFRP